MMEDVPRRRVRASLAFVAFLMCAIGSNAEESRRPAGWVDAARLAGSSRESSRGPGEDDVGNWLVHGLDRFEQSARASLISAGGHGPGYSAANGELLVGIKYRIE